MSCPGSDPGAGEKQKQPGKGAASQEASSNRKQPRMSPDANEAATQEQLQSSLRAAQAKSETAKSS